MEVGTVPCRLNGEYDIVLPKHRAEAAHWNTEQGWERKRLSRLRETIQGQYGRPRGVRFIVFYVGAESGDMATLCALWGAEMVLFEPNASAWPNIRVTWEANKQRPPLATYVGFCSDKTDEHPSHPETPPFEMRDGWPTCAYGPVIPDNDFRALIDQSHMAPQIRIDDFVERTGIVPDIISFDVEGSEWCVCRGAEQTLRKHRPTIFASIHPEFMVLQRGEYSVDFRKWITDIGYVERYLDYHHELHMVYTAEDE